MIDEFVTPELEQENINPNSGDFTISGLGSFGSLYVSGISTLGNIYSTGIITATQINAAIIGVSTLSVGYATTAGVSTYSVSSGIATYATTAGVSTYATTAGISTNVIGGISSVTQLSVTGVSTLGVTSTTDLTTQQINVSGIVTAATYVAAGTTSVYSGVVGVSTVDSNITAFHYITYDQNLSGVNISNFGSGKKFEIIARQTNANNRTIVIKTSTTATGHVAVPMIVSSGGNITNGTITLNSNGALISVYNMNGTIIGSY